MRISTISFGLLVAGSATATIEKRAPLITRDESGIEGKYIVMMKPTSGNEISTARVKSAAKAVDVKPDMVFDNLGGFSASLTARDVEDLRNNPNVAYIEQDSVARISATQKQPPWGLARVSSKTTGATRYIYDDSAGKGTCAYVLDTGIDTTHPDFEGRAEFIATYVDDIWVDDHGHGTHCAGTIGSKTYGVAKKTKLYGIKLFNSTGEGVASSIIAGMDLVLRDAPKRDCSKGVVVSMSFGEIPSKGINDAAKALVNAGFFAAAAAGNGDDNGRPVDASGFSPASEPSICTIGATTKDDTVATFSNYGKVVDLYAPGVAVLSTWPGGITRSISGTSMATPHVAGVAAYFLGLGKSAAGLCEYLQSIALKDVIKGVPSGTKNLLLQNGQAK
uniref:Cuticle-degrading protease n=1 Tax=Gibberella zeae TaxID=5518 RepID=A0A4E9DPK5_GIBZA